MVDHQGNEETCSVAKPQNKVRIPSKAEGRLLTDEQKETFEKFHDCWSEYRSLAEAAIFEYGFRLGTRLAIEVQKDSEE